MDLESLQHSRYGFIEPEQMESASVAAKQNPRRAEAS
jgi:hypothetical protein